MKNTLFLFLFSFVLVGLTNVSLAQSKENVKKQKTVSKFIGAISVHKKNKIIRNINPTYVDKHLNGTFKGDKDQFLSKFFSGTITKSGEYTKIPLDKIFGVRILELNELQAGISECKIEFITPEGPILSSFYLKAIGNKGKYYFEPRK